MALDTSVPNQKVTVKAGSVLFSEGSPANSLNVLHSGALKYIGEAPGGRKLELFKLSGANLTPGATALFTTGRYPYTILAEQDCVLSTYVMSQATVGRSLAARSSLGIMVGRSLVREITELFKKTNQLRKIASDMARTNDNLSLLYYQFNPSVFPDIKPGQPIAEPSAEIVDPVLRLSRENLKHFFDNGGILPERPTSIYVDEDHSQQLGKYYPEEIEFQDGEFNFVRKIILADPNLLAQLFASDPSMVSYACEKLGKVQSDLTGTSQGLLEEVDEAFRLLVGGPESLTEKYYLILDMTANGYATAPPEFVVPILQIVAQKIERALAGHQSLFGSALPNPSPNTKAFLEKTAGLAKKFESSAPAAASNNGGISVDSSADATAIRKELANSASTIIQFSGLGGDAIKEFSAMMVKLKSLKNPLDSDNDTRKLRRSITKTYFDIYAACFQKYINSNKNVPKPVELMLKYGHFDETMLDDSQLVFMSTYKDAITSVSDIPIHYGTEWLEKIYRRETPTSLDELGQNFFDKVKMDNRNAVYKKESDLPPDIDNPEARLKFEFGAMYEANVRLTTGSLATYLPILTKYHSQIPLGKAYVSKKMLTDAIHAVLAADFSVFNREVIYNNPEMGINKEFIQKAVIPDFVIVPSIGSKIMMWQELSIHRGSGSKESRGRIVLPIFVQGDLKSLLIDAFAAFRWELCKSILGPEWNNVGNPSITADYMDYVQFYKKNKDLSIEIKEKLAAEFKRFRNERDIFANDYQMWIKYEAEGVQRLNRVVRSIFYRHIPFSRQIREKVAKMPAFAEINNRFINIRTRKFTELENRYKKYINALGSLPEPLRENLEFYRV
ncbi:Crp/Fnr family transcriptional regulator [Leptospira wolffii]|uniref:cAMP-binding protein n=1 Tax=Leptospira wolffii TaxID=409998 RepID=A0A2M9ZB87_9LEPT|nr:cyclic nucleotide-binding domain-containing protein [Leptospira wolffii]PJZ65680.1 cAMP-binding protein [Leptospira wolffii]TGK56104.1 Crp/Fnr family transcriptional regulator [Leptospira wolffii]TGK72150.1 Crp/Fnr family transcriptional regulator [Leptospira wolffii]TGK77454.1 Crp/Fnr family transcriptional regulator [Leptospira wolffii]TGL27727.1 Crp/Fnr family transcriptional regulator [Leptospira wolffii]